MELKFKPIDPAPSDAEKTMYNVFDGDCFVGYVHKDWMGYWWFYVDGEKFGEGYDNREELFALIIDDPDPAP